MKKTYLHNSMIFAKANVSIGVLLDSINWWRVKKNLPVLNSDDLHRCWAQYTINYRNAKVSTELFFGDETKAFYVKNENLPCREGGRANIQRVMSLAQRIAEERPDANRKGIAMDVKCAIESMCQQYLRYKADEIGYQMYLDPIDFTDTYIRTDKENI